MILGTHWFTALFSYAGKPFQWWVVIAPWEQGLRVRLGRVAAMLKPGIHFRIPFLDRVYAQSVRLRTLIESNITSTTSDGKSITFTLAVEFRIHDIQELFNALSNPDSTIGSRAVSAATQFVSTNERVSLTPQSVGDEATKGVCIGEEWGLSDVRCTVMALSETRVYRFISADYRTGGGLFNLDDDEQVGLR